MMKTKRVGKGKCPYCQLVDISAKKNGTAYQHLHYRKGGRNCSPCPGSGQPLEDVMWFDLPNKACIRRVPRRGAKVVKSKSKVMVGRTRG